MLGEDQGNWQCLPTCKSGLVGPPATGMKPSSEASKKREQREQRWPQLERQAKPVCVKQGNSRQSGIQRANELPNHLCTVSSNAGRLPALRKQTQVPAHSPHAPSKRALLCRPKARHRTSNGSIKLASYEAKSSRSQDRRELPAAGMSNLPEEQGVRQVKPLSEDNEPPRNMSTWRQAREVLQQLENEITAHGQHRWSLVGRST